MCAVALLAAAAVLGGLPGFSSSARAATATSPYFTMTVTPTQGLTDGEAMTVTVTRTQAGTTAGLQITSVGTGWCTADFQAPTNEPKFTSPQYSDLPPISSPHAHCTTATYPLNANLESKTAIAPATDSSGTYPSVTATVPAETTTGTKLETGMVLTCDAGHPCTFVVAVFNRVGSTEEPIVFLSVPVTYISSSSTADCGGAASGQLTTVGPDRLGQAVTDWSIDACAAGVGGGKALTQNLASGQSDATALAAFADGNADLAYSAVGYDATASFTPAGDRPYVAVPIAINAVVLGHVETNPVTNPPGRQVFGDYPQLRITLAQAAALLGGGPKPTSQMWDSPLGEALVSENPTLAKGLYYGPADAITQNATVSTHTAIKGIVATSLPDATTFFATTFFHTVAPEAMVPTETLGHTERLGPLGVTSAFGTATPPYDVDPATGIAIMTKDLSPGTGQGFALTDAATAAAVWGGLDDLAIQTPGSLGSTTLTYVSPTPASMRAAVSEMIPQPDGTLLPNPDATAADGVNAYPLTYVEYAIAPTQPLLNGDCTPRTKAQEDLVDWLDYITGAGQTELPSGMAPLTTALQAQARSAIAQVGKATPTGVCAPLPAGSAPPPATTSPASTATTAGTTGSATAGKASRTEPLTGTIEAEAIGNTGPSAPTKASDKPGGRSREQGERPLAADLAGFKSVEGSGWMVPVVGVLLLILLLPGLALLLSGRSPRQAFAWLARRPAGHQGAPPDPS
jgi:hypothetical protein